MGTKLGKERRTDPVVILRMFIFMTLYLASIPAQSAIYKWVDKDGKTHFADSAPNHGAQQIKPEEGPSDDNVRNAKERLESTLRRLKRTEAIRKERSERQRQRKAAAQQREARDKSRCRLLHHDLHVLLQQRPVYSIDEKGEKTYMDESTRKTTIAQLRKMIAAYCQKY
jgi:hypothetical protein